jgi:hypothetical protein
MRSSVPPARRLVTLIVALVAGGLAPVAAQSSSPKDAAARFLEALAEGYWAGAARLLDLEAFREYVDHFLTRSQRPTSERPLPTVEELRRQDPSMPREVAEWQVRQMREAQERFGDPTPYEFAGVRSAAELRRLRTEEAAARWLEARDPHYSIRRQLEEMNCPVPRDDELPAASRRLIGTLADGDSAAYAVYREVIEFGGPPAGGDLNLIELKLRGGRWLIQPRGDLLPELSLGLEPGECPGRRDSR